MHGCTQYQENKWNRVSEINLSHDIGALLPTFINYCFHLIRGYSDGIRLIWRVTASSHVCTRVHPFASDSSLRKAIQRAYLSGKTIGSASRGGNLCLFVLPSAILTVLHTRRTWRGECRSMRDKTCLSSENQTRAQTYLEKPSPGVGTPHSTDVSGSGCCRGRD